MKIRYDNISLDSIPQDILAMMEAMRKSGSDVWVVGGALRDLLFGENPKDWDLAVSASPADVAAVFPKVIPVGIRHGTVRIHTKSRDVEVTSIGGRGPEGILKDLGRRDFTMNALALSYPEGDLLDPHKGREDLEAGLIRGVGDPHSRIGEDPLRILRAVRFVAVLGFSIHPDTMDAVRSGVDRLDDVAPERIREEICRILLGRNLREAFLIMRDAGILEKVLPEFGEVRMRGLGHEKNDIYLRTVYSIELSPPRLRVRLAALLHNLDLFRRRAGDHPETGFRDRCLAGSILAQGVMRRWRASNRQIEDIGRITANRLPPEALSWSDAELRRFIASAGVDLLDDLLDLAYAERVSGSLPVVDLDEIRRFRLRIHEQTAGRFPLRVRDLAVDGLDVMKALNLGEGPAIGRILSELHRMVIENPELNQREILLELIEKIGGEGP